MEKIAKLKRLFDYYNLDGYLIPKNDEFFGEYVPENKDKLKYYPFKIRHHYTKEGYLEITKTIYKFLDN